MERFLAWTAIQDTDESSSDRLMEEGRPLLRRLSFFFDFIVVHPATQIGQLDRLTFQFPLVLHESRYWLRKHRSDMPVDSGGLFAYLECGIGLENP